MNVENFKFNRQDCQSTMLTSTCTCPVQGNGRVYFVPKAAALRELLCFLPVLGEEAGALHAVQAIARFSRRLSVVPMNRSSDSRERRHLYICQKGSL